MEASLAIKELTRSDLLQMVRDILADVVDDDSLQLSESTTADDVADWDSINHVKLLIAIETELGFRFNTDEVGGLKDVGALIDLIQKKVS
jgi:acyl carrier protein